MLLNPCVSRIFFKIGDDFKAVYSIKARDNTRCLIFYYLIFNNMERKTICFFFYILHTDIILNINIIFNMIFGIKMIS